MNRRFSLPWVKQSRIRERSRQIASVLAKHGLGWLSVQLGLGDLATFKRRRDGQLAKEETMIQAEHFRMALAELGGTFIKLGQALSTRPDLIPPEYVAQLETLVDSAPEVPVDQIRQVIYEELGQFPEELFLEFDPIPTASASIGQVHAGRLKDGQQVVVKVRRPGIEEQVEVDLEILESIAEWAEANTTFWQDYNLRALVDEFAFTIRNELDYQREAENAERFKQNFADDPGIVIPSVYWDYITRRVLTMECIDGIKISDVEALDEAGLNRRAVAENAVRMMLREVFEFGFFHADPHVGNFFVRPDGSIVLIDYGMVGRIDDRLQDAMLRISLAVSRGDTTRLMDEFYKLGMVNERVNRLSLHRDLDHIVSRYIGHSMKELSASQVTNEILAAALHHHMQLPADLVLLFRVIAMSEGLGNLLDPDFRLFEFAQPYLEQFWAERYSPPALGKRLVGSAMDAIELGIDLPQRIDRLLNELERGGLNMNIHHEGLREFTHQLQRMVNRIAQTVLLSAIIVSLGLLMIIYHPTGWERIGGWLFGLTFLLAVSLGVWLIWSIWRSSRR